MGQVQGFGLGHGDPIETTTHCVGVVLNRKATSREVDGLADAKGVFVGGCSSGRSVCDGSVSRGIGFAASLRMPLRAL